MKLKHAHFDAYRSLLSSELSFSHDCIGLVGINESGKTNVLRALGCLSPDNSLSRIDLPKMARDSAPSLRYDFELNADDAMALADAFKDQFPYASAEFHEQLKALKLATLHVSYDLAGGEEQRYFSLPELRLPKGTKVLRADAKTTGYKVRLGDKNVPIEDAVFLTPNDFKVNEKLHQQSADSADLYSHESTLEARIEELNNELSSILAKHQNEKNSGSNNATDEVAAAELTLDDVCAIDKQAEASRAKLDRIRTEYQEVNARRTEIDAGLSDFDIQNIIAGSKEYIEELSGSIPQLQESLSKSEVSEKEQSGTQEQTGVNTAEAEKAKQATIAHRKKLDAVQQKIRHHQAILDSLCGSLESKYTDESVVLSERLRAMSYHALSTRLPKVVHWTYLPDYILSGVTRFEELLQAASFDDIARPLVNLFRIGLGVTTIEKLHTVIAEIQQDTGERRRSEDRLNREVGDYLKAVWPDYDQKIDIALEKELITVQFYDPKCDDASYYDMHERSQGCQSFISFVLTVGAEAREGVISDTLLLLDEPETHLHPSGVRYMLAELKKAARNGNSVVFATHSIFMIDKSEYNRHAVVKKKNERTSITLTQKERLGFFMQEEVLFEALDFNPREDFDAQPDYNIVVEGEGDAVAFDCYYRDVLNAKDRPFPLNKTHTYQGGKCSDIKKYFSRKPIKLGSTWVFLLDRDKPAIELREAIEKRYKPFLGKYVFVFHYTKPDFEEVELEDLLPPELISRSLIAAEKETRCHVGGEKYDGSHAFSAWLTKATESADAPSEFKASVKRCLNQEISNTFATVKKLEAFKELAPEYLRWVESVVELIKSKESGE